MRIDKKVFAVFWILFFSAMAADAATDAPNGFRDLAWGTPPAKNLKKLTTPAVDIAVYRPSPDRPRAPLFEAPVADEAYSFSEGKFFSASAWLDGKENFEKVKVALTRTYGPPAAANQNKHRWWWRWPERHVEIRLAYDIHFARATVTYVNLGLRASESRRAAVAASASE